MVLQQQTFMQTMTASFQQQQQSFQQQSQTFMQTMEASVQQQLQLVKQQVASSAPVPPVAPGSPVLESYRISTPSPGRSPPPPPPRDPQDAERDVFAKSDKWLPSLPIIDFSSWKDRISEALGFLTWMEKLTSWVGLGSEVFPNELMHAVRTKDEGVLGQDRLTVEQQKRSIRLLHILRQTFAGHDKSSLILQNYVEGAASYQQSGFVALRLLAKEFCLKSRFECLYFRAQLANQTVRAPTIPEIVRKIESEQHKYSKLLNSLDSDVHSQGLELQEADLVMVLLRSLPERCRSYCLLHGDSDSFEDLKRVALKYEVQQRVWSEGPGTKLSPFKGDEKGKGGDEKGTPKGRGGKKGKRDRSKSASRGGAKGNKDVECWNCGKKGHLSRDCWAPAKKNQGKDAPNTKGDGKPSPKGKAKAKGGKDKGKGKGRSVAEVAPGEGEDVDLIGNQEWTEPESEALVSSVMQIVEEARRDWIPPAQDEFVVTRETDFKVRMAELEHRIASDLSEMLGKDMPGSVKLLKGSQMNGASSLNNDQMANWWLIDSGASMTVIAKKFLDSFNVVSRMPLCPSERYSAANDTPVTVFERVRVRVKMPLYEGDSYIGMVPVMVTGVVAEVGHNILSTEHMVATGWEVKFSKAEISLRRVKGGLVGYGQSWAGCPWIYLQGAETSSKKVTFGRTHVKMEVDQEGSSSPMEVGNVSAMTVKMKEDLEVHRMRGHIPFMPGCPHCQKTRGVTQYRRGKEVGNRPAELQADFCFINLVTGTFVKDQPNAPNMKILVMTEMSIRMVGCALVGTSADHTSTWSRYWMNAFGLTTAGSAVLLRDMNPLAELKEQFGLIYCAAMHNHHSAAFDGKKSPQEEYDELAQWLNQPSTLRNVQIVFLQETWRSASEFSTQHWHWILSGVGQTAKANNGSGVAVLVNNQLASSSHIRYQEWVPGRLLEVRITEDKRRPLLHRPITLVCAYQHSRISHSPEVYAKRLRFWEKLQKCLDAVPARHTLIFGGDISTGISPMPRLVGMSAQVSTNPAQDQHEWQDIVQQQRLCLLNTWGPPGKAATYVGTDYSTLIDYLDVRERDAGHRLNPPVWIILAWLMYYCKILSKLTNCGVLSGAI
ncbi:unnamed protein product [Symbiodinium sp. CCMP2592]|nr:unnamed protein product [Symbiodinium sp. CCMP2592]